MNFFGKRVGWGYNPNFFSRARLTVPPTNSCLMFFCKIILGLNLQPNTRQSGMKSNGVKFSTDQPQNCIVKKYCSQKIESFVEGSVQKAQSALGFLECMPIDQTKLPQLKISSNISTTRATLLYSVRLFEGRLRYVRAVKINL